MKTFDQSYDEKGKIKRKGKNSNLKRSQQYIASLNSEQIARMVQDSQQPYLKGPDPTGQAIYRNALQHKPLSIQAKLEVSQPGDASEVQADKVADAVSRGDVNMSRMTMEQTGSEINMKGEGGSLTTTPEFDQQLEGTKGSGSKMESSVQRELETHTGTDLSGVKVHTGSAADAMSESINAKAFTHGQDIYFKGDNYNPGTPEGKGLLAHEVAHTVQQGNGVSRKIYRYKDPKENGFTAVKKNTTGKVRPMGATVWDDIDEKVKVLDLKAGTIVDVLYKTKTPDWYFVMTIDNNALKGGYVRQNQVELVQRDERGVVQQDQQLGAQLKSHALERLRTVLTINNVDISQLEQNQDEFQRMADLAENVNLLMVLMEKPDLFQPNVPHVTSGKDGERLAISISGKPDVEFPQSTTAQLNIMYRHDAFSFEAGNNPVTIYKANYTAAPLKIGAPTLDDAWKIAAQYLTPNTGQKFEYNGIVYAFAYRDITDRLEANDHVIQQGETISSIAAAKGITEEELLSANGYMKKPDGTVVDVVTEQKHTFKPGDLIVIPEPEEPEDMSWMYRENPTMLSAYASLQEPAAFNMGMATISSIEALRTITVEEYNAFVAYEGASKLVQPYSREQLQYTLDQYNRGNRTNFYPTEMHVVNFLDFMYKTFPWDFPAGSISTADDFIFITEWYETALNRFSMMFLEKGYQVALDLLRANRYILLNEAEKYGLFNNGGLGYDFSSVRETARNSQGAIDRFYSNQAYFNEELSKHTPGDEYEESLGYGVHLSNAQSRENYALYTLGGERMSLTADDPLLSDPSLWPRSLVENFSPVMQFPVNLPNLSPDTIPSATMPADTAGTGGTLFFPGYQPQKSVNTGPVRHPKSAIEQFQTASDDEIAGRLRLEIIGKLKQIDEAEEELKSRKDEKHFIWRCPQIIEETKVALGIAGIEPYETILKAPPAKLAALDAFVQIVSAAVAIGLLFIPGGGILAWAVSAGIQGFAIYKQYENQALKKKMYEASLPYGKTLENDDPDLDWLWLDIIMIVADIPGAVKILKQLGKTAKGFLNGTVDFQKYKKATEEAAEIVGETGQKIVRNKDEFVENVANKYDPEKTTELADVRNANKSRKQILSNADPAEVDELRRKFPDADDTEIAGHLKLKKQGTLHSGLLGIFGESDTMRMIAKFSANSDHFMNGIKILRGGLDDDLFAQVIAHYIAKNPKMRNIITSVGKSQMAVGDVVAIAKKAMKAKFPSKRMQIFHENLLMTMGRRAGGGERGLKSLRFILGNLDKRYARRVIKAWEERFGQSVKLKLSEVFDDFANVAGKFRKSNETLLEYAEPGLFEMFKQGKLPPAVQKRLDELLNDDLIGSTDLLTTARGNMSSKINNAIGESITSLDDFKNVINVLEQPGSRGSIGEIFFRRFLAGSETSLEKYRQVLFDKQILGPGATKGVRPDRIRPVSKRTLDVKTGYADSGIDVEQLKSYERLVQQSQKTGGKVQQQLAGMGIDGSLKGHDYLFLPGKTGSSREAAEKAFELIASTADNAKNFKVYYVDDAGNIFEYLGKNQNPQLIGNKLPD